MKKDQELHLGEIEEDFSGETYLASCSCGWRETRESHGDAAYALKCHYQQGQPADLVDW